MTESLLLKLRRAFGLAKDSPTSTPLHKADKAEGARADVAQCTAASEPATPVEAPVTLTIWMIERDRYGVRGRALCTDMEVYESEAVRLCEDVMGYVLNTPSGETVVVEARSGGLVGNSLESVLDGVRDMPSSELIRQIDTNRKEFNRMKQMALPNAEFWAALKMGASELEPGQDY
ncbi:MAG TPA: hypothetical protein VFR06_09595 [Gallionellaceae bacterium]|nr:hypothetical protein [Gallionellaceae bacterium]